MSDSTAYEPPQGIDLPKIPRGPSYNIRDFKAKYREGTDYLDRNYAFFLTHVLNIGPPEWTNMVPTAAVGFRPDSGEKPEDFRFLFNGQFAMTLSGEHMGFVEAHETMHILLDHLRLFQKQKDKKFPNHMIFNVAADCVINDYLNSRGLDVPEWVCRGENLVGYDCTNATVTQVYSDLDHLVQQAKQQAGQCPQCGGSGEVPDDDDQNGQGQEGEQGEGDSAEGQGSGEGQGQPQDGEGGKGSGGHQHDPNATKPCPHCGGSGQSGPDFSGQFDDHSWMDNPKLDKAIEKVRQEAEKAQGAAKLPKDLQDKADEDQGKKDNSRGLMPGMGVTDERSFSEVQGVSLKWVDLLKEINPDVIRNRKGPPPRPSYHTPRRKLMGIRQINPDINLPVYKKKHEDKGETPSIVMALDTSGSIGDDDANRFINLARSIPRDKIHLFACTFQSVYMPLDLDNPVWRSGGTDFGTIEEFIQKDVIPSEEFKKTKNKTGYPNAVVVVTDGYASFGQQGGVNKPMPEFYDRWFWLIMNFDNFKGGNSYGSSYWNGIKDIGRHESLAKFTAGTKMAKEMEQYK